MEKYTPIYHKITLPDTLRIFKGMIERTNHTDASLRDWLLCVDELRKTFSPYIVHMGNNRICVVGVEIY